MPGRGSRRSRDIAMRRPTMFGALGPNVGQRRQGGCDPPDRAGVASARRPAHGHHLPEQPAGNARLHDRAQGGRSLATTGRPDALASSGLCGLTRRHTRRSACGHAEDVDRSVVGANIRKWNPTGQDAATPSPRASARALSADAAGPAPKTNSRTGRSPSRSKATTSIRPSIPSYSFNVDTTPATTSPYRMPSRCRSSPGSGGGGQRKGRVTIGPPGLRRQGDVVRREAWRGGR
jgi:hypothetical protein